MDVVFRKKGPVLLAVDARGSPLQCSVTGTLNTRLAKGTGNAWYVAVKVAPDSLPYLLHVDKCAQEHTEGSPLRGDSLLVKVPHRGRDFQCKFEDAQGFMACDDILDTPGVRVQADLVFGGVWERGYTWKAVAFRKA